MPTPPPLALNHSPVPVAPAWPTLAAALRAAAADDPDRLYVDLLDAHNASHPLTYAATLAAAEHAAAHLLHRGLTPGDRVALLLPTGADFVTALYGTLLAGGVPVPWPVPLAPGGADAYLETTVSRVFAHSGARLLVADPRLAAPAARLMAALGHPDGLLTPDDLAPAAPPAPLPAVAPDDLALLQYTSGNTTAPTGVALTHRQILANVDGLGRALRLSRDDVAVSWIPPVHDMGLIGGLFAGLYWRYPSHLMAPESFLMRPQRWLQNLSTFGATLSAAPNFAYGLCARRVSDRHLDGLDLSRWRLALNGAEMVHDATVRSFLARFAPVGLRPDAMVPIYGLAENALAATSPDLALAQPYRTRPLPAAPSPWPVRSPAFAPGAPVVSVGRPLPGQAVAIVGPDDQVLAEGAIGQVLVRGPSLMRGYHDAPQATARVLRDGWLHTGDLGFIIDGDLHIVGRTKPMVIKMGRNYFPADIERLARAATGASAASAFPEDDPASGTERLVVRLAAPAPTGADPKQLEAQVNTALLAGLGLRADRVELAEAAP